MTADELTLRVIESTRELISIEDAWDDLWEESDVSVPSARARIVSLWVESFAPDAEFRALVVANNGVLVGALPMVGRRFLPMVNTGGLPRNIWSATGELLLRSGVEVNSVLDEMISGFNKLPWRQFVFEQIPYEESRWRALRLGLERASRYSSVIEQHQVGQVEISDDWNAYEATRKSRHRQRRRRNARMLEQTGKTELKVYSLLDCDDVETYLRHGFQVEEKSWKARAGTAVLSNQDKFSYYLKEARQLSKWRQLELVFLEHNEIPIAFCYGWNAKGVRFCVKVGFDEEYRKYGPGQQQILRLLERIHSDPGCVLYDFHGRLVPWTESWITTSYPVGRLIVGGAGSLDTLLLGVYTKLHPILKKISKIIRRQ